MYNNRRPKKITTRSDRLRAAFYGRRKLPRAAYRQLEFEGRYFHYISDDKLETIAQEVGLPVTSTHERENKFDLRGVSASRKTTSTFADRWRVNLAEDVTVKLFELDQVGVFPDFSKRYIFGTLYAEWGVLETFDFKDESNERRVAWFQAATGAEILALCGSVHHLRGMNVAERWADWFPSAMDGMVEFMKRATQSRQSHVFGWNDPRPETRESDADLLSEAIGYTSTSHPRYRGWADFLAVSHLVMPGLTIEDRRDRRYDPRPDIRFQFRGDHVEHTFEQAVFGSPVWVSDTCFTPPGNWYPDPEHADEGWWRYWDGNGWTEHVFYDGWRSLHPIPQTSDQQLPHGRTAKEIIHSSGTYARGIGQTE